MKHCSECDAPFVAYRNRKVQQTCSPECKLVRKARLEREKWQQGIGSRRRHAQRLRFGVVAEPPIIPGMPCGMGEWESAANWGIRYEEI